MAEYAFLGVDGLDSKKANEIEQKVTSNSNLAVKYYDIVKSKVKVAGKIIVTVRNPSGKANHKREDDNKKKRNNFNLRMIEGNLDGKEADNFLKAIPIEG